MATTRPFAYNTGSTIDGTTQIGNIAIGVSEQDYSLNPGGVKWWMGPDEDLGYVIANVVQTGDHPTPVDVDSYINFWRSTDLTDQSLLDLLNVLPITDGVPPFGSANDAKTWLNDNGHFTSYGEGAPPPTPTPTPTVTVTPTPTSTVTSTPTPTPTTATYYYYYLLNCNLVDNKYGRSVNPSLSGDTFNISGNTCYSIVGNDPGTYYDYDLDIATLVTDCTDASCDGPTPTPTPTNTQTPTNTVTPSTTPTNTPTPTPTSTPTPTPTSAGAGDGWFFYTSDNGAVMTAPSNNGDVVFIINGLSTYNPNYIGGSFNIFFNNNNSAGTSYVSQFSGLDTTGGTITISQGSSAAIYSGTSANYQTGVNWLQFNLTNASQIIQEASTPFVSGTTISLTFGNAPNVTPTTTPTPSVTSVTPTPTPTISLTPSITPTNTPTISLTPSTTPTNTPTISLTPSTTPTNTPTPTITPSATPNPTNVIVAAGGVNVLGYSYDGGDNWTNSSNGATFISQPAFAVATDGNMFVAGGTPAGGNENSLLWSNDGNTWSGSTNGLSMFTTNVRGVAYGGDKWVAVGISSGSGKFAYSTDGKTWTAASNSNVIGSVPLSVAYNGSRWVATGQSPAGGSGNRTTIAYSDDGISWTASANSGTIFTGTCWNVAWGGDKWVAVGTGANRIAYSSDGITWSGSTSGNSRITGTGYGISHNGSQWVAAGQGTNALAYSSDGITWSGSTNGNTIFSFQSYCVTWAGTKWVAGGIGTNQLATSTDGLTWSATTNGNTIMNNRVQAIAAKY